MADYISREAALACFNDWIDRYGHEHTAEEMVEYHKIEDLPAADVRPVVRATWKRIDYKPCGHDYECSSCGWKNDMETHFCPTCGADMRPEKNDQRGKQQGRENRKTLR